MYRLILFIIIIFISEKSNAIVMYNSNYIITSDTTASIATLNTNNNTNLISNAGSIFIFTEDSTNNYIGNDFIYTILGNAYLQVEKTISNIILNGNIITSIIPGCTINYLITITNYPIDDAGYKVIIYDRLCNNVSFKTAHVLYNNNFTFEWSTNSFPEQTYNSSNYFTNFPLNVIKDRVKWIRWKIKIFGINEKGRIGYTSILK